MFDRVGNLSRRIGRGVRALLLGLLAAVTGCDREVEWRGVGTDGRDAGRPASPDATKGESADGKPG